MVKKYRDHTDPGILIWEGLQPKCFLKIRLKLRRLPKPALKAASLMEIFSCSSMVLAAWARREFRISGKPYSLLIASFVTEAPYQNLSAVV